MCQSNNIITQMLLMKWKPQIIRQIVGMRHTKKLVRYSVQNSLTQESIMVKIIKKIMIIMQDTSNLRMQRNRCLWRMPVLYYVVIIFSLTIRLQQHHQQQHLFFKYKVMRMAAQYQYPTHCLTKLIRLIRHLSTKMKLCKLLLPLSPQHHHNY